MQNGNVDCHYRGRGPDVDAQLENNSVRNDAHNVRRVRTQIHKQQLNPESGLVGFAIYLFRDTSRKLRL